MHTAASTDIRGSYIFCLVFLSLYLGGSAIVPSGDSLFSQVRQQTVSEEQTGTDHAIQGSGYALENAFLESREDIRMLYGEHSAMYRELELIRRGMILNITLEELISDLADRSGIEEIEQFSAILNIAKRGGGNVTQIIRTTAEVISNKVETMQEMLTMLQGRRLEQNVMEIMPFGISLYIAAAYPGYFGTLYHNGMGIIVMTLCLAVYAGAYLLGEKILDRIEEEL